MFAMASREANDRLGGRVLALLLLLAAAGSVVVAMAVVVGSISTSTLAILALPNLELPNLALLPMTDRVVTAAQVGSSLSSLQLAAAGPSTPRRQTGQVVCVSSQVSMQARWNPC